MTKSQAPPAHTDLRVQRSWAPVTSSEEQSVWPRSVPSFIDIQNWAEKHWTSKRPKDSEQGRRQSNWFIIIPASLVNFSLVYLILSWKIKLWSHFFLKVPKDSHEILGLCPKKWNIASLKMLKCSALAKTISIFVIYLWWWQECPEWVWSAVSRRHKHQPRIVWLQSRVRGGEWPGPATHKQTWFQRPRGWHVPG